MVFPVNFWLLFAAMVISSIGFKKYVWFISLGYGFSIAGEGLLMAILYGKTLTPGTLVCCCRVSAPSPAPASGSWPSSVTSASSL